VVVNYGIDVIPTGRVISLQLFYPTAIQIYARMAFDLIREAMEKAQNDMLLAAGIDNIA
jgi:hypothetical protein